MQALKNVGKRVVKKRPNRKGAPKRSIKPVGGMRRSPKKPVKKPVIKVPVSVEKIVRKDVYHVAPGKTVKRITGMIGKRKFTKVYV